MLARVWAGAVVRAGICAGVCPGSVCAGVVASAGVAVWSPVAVVVVISPRFFLEVRFLVVCGWVDSVWGAGVCGVCAGLAGAGFGGSCAASTRTSPPISEKASVTRSNTEPDIFLRMDVSSRVRYAAQTITDAPVH
jgi:hypothetical protein